MFSLLSQPLSFILVHILHRSIFASTQAEKHHISHPRSNKPLSTNAQVNLLHPMASQIQRSKPIVGTCWCPEMHHSSIQRCSKSTSISAALLDLGLFDCWVFGIFCSFNLIVGLLRFVCGVYLDKKRFGYWSSCWGAWRLSLQT